MKTTLIRIVAFLGFFIALSQCATDKPDMKPVIIISSATQLAADTSFVAAVKMNRMVAATLFGKMRLLGSNEARRQQALRIAQLIDGASSHNNAAALAKEFGFESEYEFKNSIFVLLKRRIELTTRYSNYEKITPAIQKEAYNITVAKLNKISFDTPVTNSPGICALCFFNNCDECNGCDTCVEQPAPGDGGGSNACKNACQNIRYASRNIAEIEVIAEFSTICPGVTWTVTEIALCLGPVGAAAAGVCTYAGCGSLAYLRYLNSISLAENNYIVCVNGCN